VRRRTAYALVLVAGPDDTDASVTATRFLSELDLSLTADVDAALVWSTAAQAATTARPINDTIAKLRKDATRDPACDRMFVVRRVQTTAPLRYAFNGLAGCVAQSKSRATGTLVGLYYGPDAGIDGDPSRPWITSCEDHGTTATHASQTLARASMPDPKNWCDACRDEETP